jgi:hypothetical protein
MVKGLLHEPGKRLRASVLDFRANQLNEMGISGVHFNRSGDVRTRRSCEQIEVPPLSWLLKEQMARDASDAKPVKSLNRQLNDLSCATEWFH